MTIPGRAELLIPDLGADRTWRVVHDQRSAAGGTREGRGTLTVQGEVIYAPGSGPRHVVFHSPSSSLISTLSFVMDDIT